MMRTIEEHRVLVQARYTVVDANAQAAVAKFNERSKDKWPEWTARAREVQTSRRSIDAKFRALYALVDDMAKAAEGLAACKRGCNHCCHIAVGLTQGEAEVLGRAIGVKPVAKVKHRANYSGFDWGYHNPCTFLRDGECSIYEHRPMACRSHFNMDVDALLCECYPPDLSNVPYFNNQQLTFIAASISHAAGKFTMQDIRTFFPNYNKGRQKGTTPK